MSAALEPIRVVVQGVEHSFVDLDALVEWTQSYAVEVQKKWRNRGVDMKPEVALAWLIKNADELTALTEAGLRRIDQEKAEAEKVLAEIDRLVGELLKNFLERRIDFVRMTKTERDNERTCGIRWYLGRTREYCRTQ